MLAGRKVALLNRALVRVALRALQKQFHALAAALPAHGARISSQWNSPSFRGRSVYGWLAFFPVLLLFYINLQLLRNRTERTPAASSAAAPAHFRNLDTRSASLPRIPYKMCIRNCK
jgi:hypothetical protein